MECHPTDAYSVRQSLADKLGHANIATTQRSMHLDDRELADAQDLVE